MPVTRTVAAPLSCRSGRPTPADCVPRRADALAAALTFAGALAALGCALASDGAHHDDDLLHLQLARWAWQYPAYFLDEWGRPGFTVLYAAPALLGWTAARIFTLALTAATAWLAYCIARRAGVRWAALVPALVWLQPGAFTLSLTTLTEPVLGFYLTLAYWLYCRGMFARSAAVVSLCAVTRHEAVLFLTLWFVALLGRRRPPREWLWLAWAPLIHNLLAWLFLPTAPLQLLVSPLPTDEYGAGGWLAMLTRWAMAAGAAQLVLGLIGGGVLWRCGAGRLWIACGAAYFLAHTLLFRFGLFASGGYERFLVPLAPLVAVAAAVALQRWLCAPVTALPVGGALICGALWLSAELEIWPAYRGALPIVRIGALTLLFLFALAALAVSRGAPAAADSPAATPRMSRARRLVAALPVVVLALGIAVQPAISASLDEENQRFVPLRLNADQRRLRLAATALRELRLADRPLVTANPWVREFTGAPSAPGPRLSGAALDELPPGGVFVWEARYAPSAAYRISPQDIARRGDFCERWRDPFGADDVVRCIIFEKRAPLPTPADPAPANARPESPNEQQPVTGH